MRSDYGNANIANDGKLRDSATWYRLLWNKADQHTLVRDESMQFTTFHLELQTPSQQGKRPSDLTWQCLSIRQPSNQTLALLTVYAR